MEILSELYNVWMKIWSELYNIWMEILSELYNIWMEILSELYDIWMEILNELYNIWMEILSELYYIWTEILSELYNISFGVSEVTGFDDVGNDKLAGFLSECLAGLNGYAICECIEGIQYSRWQGSNATYGTPATTAISNQDECSYHHPDPSYKTCKSHEFAMQLRS
jgi:hypothetical protein